MLAIHDSSGVPVAIKYLSEALFADKTFLTRFRVEARLLAGIRDPHLVRFYEYVESGSGAAIIMELVDGITLRVLLRREGPTGPEAALTVLKGSLLGLAAAHSAGVVHRDYKPSNVLIDGNGDSKLADFGIAPPAGHPSGEPPSERSGRPRHEVFREASEKTSVTLNEATPSGTPAYMAPEQWAGEPATPATDVYAATAVFYECLTGRPPYQRETAALLAKAHESAPIPIKQVPEPLWVMFAHGLAKDPMDRPPTAAMFLDEVEEAARAAYGPKWEAHGRSRLVEMAALLVLLFPLTERPNKFASVLGLTRLGPNKSRTLAAAGTGLLVIAAGIGIAALQPGHRIHPPSNVAAPMSTPRPVPKGKAGGRPAPSPSWSMPGLPSGNWASPPGALPTSPVANPSPAGGTKPGPSKPGGGKPGGTKPGGTPTGGGGTPTGGGTSSGSGTPTGDDGGGGGGGTGPTEPETTPISPPTDSPPTEDPSGGTGSDTGGGGASVSAGGLSVSLGG